MKETTNYNSINTTCDFVLNRNHQYSQISFALFQMPQNIIYMHHCFEIIVVIRPTARSCYLMHQYRSIYTTIPDFDFLHVV